MMPGRPDRGRVITSHHIIRAAFRAALVFAVLAAAWSVVVLVAGGSWWGPLHTFLAGTVLLAISGASQMFTITWASTRPPAPATVLIQRWLLCAGVAAVLVGVRFSVPSLVWVGGAAAVAAVVLLAGVIRAAVRRSLLRRFDLSSRFYLTAFASGAVGIALGTIMGAGAAGGSFTNLRLAHAHLNLTGLVGLTIIGTLPTLLPTTAYARAVSGGEAVLAWWLALTGAAAIVAGIWFPRAVGVGSALIAVAGAIVLTGILRRLWSRGRHKPPFVQITLGSLWLIGWGLLDGFSVTASGAMPHFGGWTGAVVIGGVGQVLAGSLAYLVPVLKGSPFPPNRQVMEGHPWLPLVCANGAALSLGLGLTVAAVVLCAVWVGDFGMRLIRVVWGSLGSQIAPPH